MKNNQQFIAQSCDSRECRKKYKEETNKMCEAVTTVHIFYKTKREFKCTKCGKITKLPKN